MDGERSADGERVGSGEAEPLRLSELRQQTASSGGLACPACGCCDWRVRNTERLAGQIRRYRVCRHCGRVRRTVERAG